MDTLRFKRSIRREDKNIPTTVLGCQNPVIWPSRRNPTMQIESKLPRAFVLLAFAWMCFSLFVQGAQLEGRGYARRLEWVRVALTAVLTAVSFSIWPNALLGIAYVLAVYTVASGLAFGIEKLLPTARLTPA